MIKFKSEMERSPRRHRAWWLLPLLLLLPAAALVEEHWRGHWELQSWKHKMTAKGEMFDPAKLWPPSSAASMDFSNQLGGTVKEFSGKLNYYGASVSTIILDGSGQAHRGSQGSFTLQNPGAYSADQTFSWEELNQLIQEKQSALQHLRELMKAPPAGINYDIVQRLNNDSMPNFVAWRIAAQTLHGSALNNLHKGDLQAAEQDLEALLAFGKLGEKDPGLVSFMIRMAIIGLSVDVGWDALQADGWTEPQLAALQAKCLEVTNVLSQMPKTLEAERIGRSYLLNWFRTHSYEQAVERCQKSYAGFGLKPSPKDTADPVRFWRQWVFHPLWSYAWAEQEELKYLQDLQPELTALREAGQRQSWLALRDETKASHQNYRAPFAAWRFYVKLPLDEGIDFSTGSKLQDSGYPYADFSKAWFWAMRNLTLHEMVITVIAIKRYELKHGKAPADLAALVPEFLSDLPPDLMDGQPLRYQLGSNGCFKLYSVGDDSPDDGCPPPWKGKDWIWPQVMKAVKDPHVAAATASHGGE